MRLRQCRSWVDHRTAGTRVLQEEGRVKLSWFDRPTRCLPFDRTGTAPRHRGTGPLKQVENSVFPFDFQSAGSPTTRGSCREYVVDSCEWPENGNELRPGT